jgi:hypothetical protein
MGIARHRGGPAAMLAAALSVLAAALLPANPAAAAGRLLQASSHTVWLCQPGAGTDPCTSSRSATTVAADGTMSPFSTDASSAAHKYDCFYVYPTVSKEPGLNSDLAVQPEETEAAQAQASQFSSVCNVWAPMYRQGTTAAVATYNGVFPPEVTDVAYNSVLAAWKDYLAHDNHGRPIIFIGHSQGAVMLIKLLRTQIDPSARLRKRLLSAILLGGNVQVPTGRAVGGSFRHIPTCHSPSETGCVIAYSTFPSEPASDALLGRPGQGVSLDSGQGARSGQQVACVNPVSFSSATGDLMPLMPTSIFNVRGVTTPWIAAPFDYTAQCVQSGGASWLQVTRVNSVGDQRPVIADEGLMWGYHDYDVNLALGNLVLDVAYQEATHR